MNNKHEQFRRRDAAVQVIGETILGVLSAVLVAQLQAIGSVTLTWRDCKRDSLGCYLVGLNWWERLERLGFLECMRLRGDLIVVHIREGHGYIHEGHGYSECSQSFCKGR